MAPRGGGGGREGVGAGAPPDLGQTRRRAEEVAARGRGGAGGGGMGARGREAGEAEGGGCAPRAALDGAAAMAAEAEGQHGVVGRGLAEGLRDFFFGRIGERGLDGSRTSWKFRWRRRSAHRGCGIEGLSKTGDVAG